MAKDKDNVKMGRPPIYDNVDDMIIKIDEYFDSLIPEVLKIKDVIQLHPKTGEPLYTRPDYPTQEGLALYLGYASKQSLYDNDKGDFSYPIKRAKTRICERAVQFGMRDEIPTALAIFIMKNFGYTDKMDIQHSGEMTIGKPPTLEDAEFPE